MTEVIDNLLRDTFSKADEIATKKGKRIGNTHIFHRAEQTELLTHITYVPTSTLSIADIVIEKSNVIIGYDRIEDRHQLLAGNEDNLHYVSSHLSITHSNLGLR